MNVFRLLGDFCHLYSILVLVYKIHTRKTCAGISLKTRALYLLIFLTRYEDLFLYFISLYNTAMKLLYLGASGYICYLMAASPEYKSTWYRELDRFAAIPLIAASFVLALVCTAKYSFFELSWTFSVILESVAILPQLHHLTLVPTLPALPLSHLVALGLYRFFYVVNWVFRLAGSGSWDNTAFCFGVVQTVVWADFLWVWYHRKQIKLPGISGVAPLHGAAGEGVEEGTQTTVDEADMAQSFVLKLFFRAAKTADDVLFGGRATVQHGLSVSAYPDHQVRIERGATANPAAAAAAGGRAGAGPGGVGGGGGALHAAYRDDEQIVENITPGPGPAAAAMVAPGVSAPAVQDPWKADVAKSNGVGIGASTGPASNSGDATTAPVTAAAAATAAASTSIADALPESAGKKGDGFDID